MSNIDKRALREAAERALPAMMRLLMMPNDELFDEALLNVDGDVDAANAFNLLAGPETVLAMLDELEESERLRLKFQEANCELCQKLEAAEKTSAARLGAIDTTHKMFQRERDRAEAAEKRIAELEARESVVKIKPPVIGRAYSALNRVWTEQEVRKACELAGIKLHIAAAGKGE